MSVVKSSDVRIGIFGGSAYAAEMLDLFQLRVKGCQVIATFALHTDEPAARLATSFGLPVFQDLPRFFDFLNGHAQVLYNAAPPHLHYEISRYGIEQGLNIWLEKPPVTSLKVFEAMERVINKNHELVQVCFNTLYNPALLSLRKALQTGVFGRIRAIHTVGGLLRPVGYFHRNKWAGRIEADGHLIRDGSLSNALSHTVVNALFCGAPLGTLLDTLTLHESRLCRLVSPEAEDTASLKAIGSDGCVYTFNLSLGIDEKIPPTNRIETDAGTIHFENYKDIRFGHDIAPLLRTHVEPDFLNDDVRLNMISTLRKATLREAVPPVPFGNTRPFVELLETVYGNHSSIENLSVGNEDQQTYLKKSMREALFEAYKRGSVVEF